MSHHTSRRALLFTLALLIPAAAFATTPSARYDSKMVYDPVTTHSVLFGGNTAVDPSTKLSYEFSDTWDWNGTIWTQLFPLNTPTARYGHVMVYDAKRDRMVMFGGRTGNSKTDLNDTWVFKNGDWTQLDPPTSPPARVLADAVYDPIRDRVVLFGGTTITSDSKTSTPFYDTWEFDGTTWTQVLSDGPKVEKPIMVWDAARANILMLGIDTNIATHQYNYDPAAKAWVEKTGTRLPSCVNQGGLAYQSDSGTVFFTGGACPGVTSIEDNEEWDGNQWNPKTVAVNTGRVFGPAMTFDDLRQQTLLFGGVLATGTVPRNQLWIYSGDWVQGYDPNYTPPARELMAFLRDDASGVIWLFSGRDPDILYADLWTYQYGKWQRFVTADPGPQSCISPASAFDTDRRKLVVFCADNTMAEFDLTDWKSISGLTKNPPVRAFSSMTYDPNIKKSVLFGGYDSSNTHYNNDTWLWDGTAWTQVTKNLPPQRINAAMWFDPHLNRTVIFGGVGRASPQDRVTRFNDMWSFDGTGWTQIKPAHTPPPLYGVQLAVDPTTGNALLFGGLRTDTVTNPVTGNNQPATIDVQSYVSDFWQWDGTDWTQPTFPRIPYARENGAMAFDPSTQRMVLFGGYAGQQWLSDTWTLTPDKGWQPQITNAIRRRALR
ncbi:MAG TPA: kelch repeat-containing protein [Thermoanaerobaculia bacterium]|nr:kelch repeat-containing protein [Thermoanaerobaculia bacterium]